MCVLPLVGDPDYSRHRRLTAGALRFSLVSGTSCRWGCSSARGVEVSAVGLDLCLSLHFQIPPLVGALSLGTCV